MNAGNTIGLLGVVLSVILCGVGSAVGLYMTASAASGVLGEDPKKFGKVLVLVLLPATQGIYGFIVAILSWSQALDAKVLADGFMVMAKVLPMAVAGLVTGILQGKAAANCIYAVGKQESLGGKLIIYPAMIEFYAILGMLISILITFTL